MKLKKGQFCEYVDKYREMVDQEDTILSTLDIGSEWVFSSWLSNYYELFSELCELSKDDSYDTILDWFCFEADFGRNKEVNVLYDLKTNRKWTINSPGVLYDYIMEKYN